MFWYQFGSTRLELFDLPVEMSTKCVGVYFFTTGILKGNFSLDKFFFHRNHHYH